MSKAKQVSLFILIFSVYSIVCTDEYNEQVSLKTLNSICNKPTVPVLYKWALLGVEYDSNKVGV